MRFTLTFEGDLPSNGKTRDKWNIRKQFHPQFVELWNIDPSLQMLLKHRIISENLVTFFQHRHHDSNNPIGPIRTSLGPQDRTIDLCQEIERQDVKFMPLVRNSLLLSCGLKITFLRSEPPGRVYQGGDLDNRLKTLFDALSVPNNDQIVPDSESPNPIYCLLEDDSLITAVDIDTHRLLAPPNASKHHVKLIVEVSVRVTQPRGYNQIFLGS